MYLVEEREAFLINTYEVTFPVFDVIVYERLVFHTND